MGQGGLTGLVADFLQRTVGPIRDQWQFDASLILFDQTVYYCLITFLDGPLLKQSAQLALCLTGQGEHHDAGGIQIQPVYQSYIRILDRQPSNRTILIFRCPPGHTQQIGWFVDQQNMIIPVYCADPLMAGGHNIIGFVGEGTHEAIRRRESQVSSDEAPARFCLSLCITRFSPLIFPRESQTRRHNGWRSAR